jgi:hypothetical protein
MISGQDTRSARCVETRTAGAAGGPGKPTGSNPGRAPRSDPTGRFYRSELYPFLRRVNTYLTRWARKKYKRLRSYKRFSSWWTGLLDRDPGLFRHWAWERQFCWKR